MNAQLNFLVAQQHAAELHRAAARARLASDAKAQARSPRKSGRIARLTAWLAPARA